MTCSLEGSEQKMKERFGSGGAAIIRSAKDMAGGEECELRVETTRARQSLSYFKAWNP